MSSPPELPAVVPGLIFPNLQNDISNYIWTCFFFLKGLPVALEKHILGFDTGGKQFSSYYFEIVMFAFDEHITVKYVDNAYSKKAQFV